MSTRRRTRPRSPRRRRRARETLHLLEHYDGPTQVNIGTGEDVTIKELAKINADAMGYTGTIEWDTSEPDGTPHKVLDVRRLMGSGWSPTITLEDGIISTVRWFREHMDSVAQWGVRLTGGARIPPPMALCHDAGP